VAIVACGGDGVGSARPELLVFAEAPFGLEPCAAAGAVTQQSEGDVVLSDPAEPPCRIVAVRRLALTPSATGAYPDPASLPIAMDSKGGIVTGAMQSGVRELLVWDATGRFVRTFGREGEGPGEIPRGGDNARPYIGPGDSIYALHFTRWLVFSPDHRFVREIRPPPDINRQPQELHVLDDGGLLSTTPLSSAGGSPAFQVFDRNGKLVRAFGDTVSSGRAQSSGYGGGATFWVAPPGSPDQKYELTEWTLTGTRVRTITRESRWFRPPNIVVPVPDRSTLPSILWVHVDPEGYIWVVSQVKDERWRQVDDRAERNALASELADVRVEVIDPLRSQVLVSERIDTFWPDTVGIQRPVVQRFLPRSRMSYRTVLDTVTGLVTVEVYDLHLIRR
jgi:hypothetical protein